MRELSLDRLRTLLAIVDQGSFIGAARALHLAPPTVSLHVSELEQRLGAQLLVRERGAVMPTGVGALLIERARLLLNQADALLEDLQLQIQGKSGRVRLSASTPVIAHLLPAALERLAGAHPGIEVELSVHTSSEAMARVADGAIDIGIVALPQPCPPGVRLIDWRRDPVKALVPAAWNPPAYATPAWLAARPLILNDARTRLSRITGEWFAAAGFHPRARIEHNYNEAIKSLVAAGYGATLLSVLESADSVDPRIATVPLRPALSRPLGIAHRSAGVEAAVRHVLDALAQGNADPRAGRRARPARAAKKARLPR